jgi:histidinol-phosphate/aromatic aminotransferase/cobyric acid decarboxylase-like protein
MGVDPSSLLDLSASLNPVGPDVPGLLVAHLDAVRRYPDASDAHRHLAAALGVERERLLLTNGGAEAIALMAHEIGGRVSEPEFSLHPRGDGSKPVWRSNPHNPSGLLAGVDEHADVWDEAFYPLAAGRWTRGDDAALAIVGSLTKVFACPGLRLGYIVAEPELVARVANRQPSWSVGNLALAVLPELLATAELARWRDEIALLRRSLVDMLRSYGLNPLDSDANFVLCEGPESLRDDLIVQGIVVRDCASFGLHNHIRIAVPHFNDIERLSRALGRALR